ncbi:FAD-binding protein [Halobellus sp. GM3]|uniref:FAD-binding protein n=1 Tax=Halobellus sp. GM3 TaxID=3458410 RepID=UPI00403D8297
MSDVLAVAEHRQGALREVSYQLLTAARGLADALGGDVHVAVIGGDTDTFADQVNRRGVDVIHTVADGDEFNHDVYVQAVEQLYEAVDPAVVVTPNSVNGLDYAPAVARGLDCPIVTNLVDAAVDEGTLIATREQYGSKVEVDLEVDGFPCLLTLREGEWESAPTGGDADVRAAEVAIDESAVGSTVTGFEAVAAGDVDISEADFLVSVGRGIEEEENLELVEELCEVTGATLSSSRPIVDSGWLPANRQVGQSGKTVTPDVYLAIGISGAVQHLAGMKGSETIIAVNTDPDAPIFDVADYGIVGDLFDVVPELIDAFE